MSQLITRGARIMDASFYCGSNGTALTLEIKMRAAWSEPVCREMHWDFTPEGFGNGKLEGSLNAVSLTLEPNDKKLKDYAIDIGVGLVSKFRHIAKTEDGDTVKREMEFVVTTSGENAAKALPSVATYVEMCGPGDDRGQCKITYNAAVQETLPGTKSEPETAKKAAAK